MASIRKQKKIAQRKQERLEKKTILLAKRSKEEERLKIRQQKRNQVREALGFDNILKQIKSAKHDNTW